MYDEHFSVMFLFRLSWFFLLLLYKCADGSEVIMSLTATEASLSWNGPAVQGHTRTHTHAHMHGPSHLPSFTPTTTIRPAEDRCAAWTVRSADDILDSSRLNFFGIFCVFCQPCFKMLRCQQFSACGHFANTLLCTANPLASPTVHGGALCRSVRDLWLEKLARSIFPR